MTVLWHKPYKVYFFYIFDNQAAYVIDINAPKLLGSASDLGKAVGYQNHESCNNTLSKQGTS
jgi:hypothetical protein